ncbi:DUF58 domain-containing protein [Azoarcus sp. KH32C]|uniref:DUF58 domain-containing protein n=1 Tax=Azoarcus sp. KH32C TaxID=748247 RepID=UPI0002386AEF|nr:DUF58 domain-containing protein [Azoarcus sp. KH32C]BAL22715.1 hypothetical protein AZKH_0369 [Azoarcus sp. KH32C]
MSPDFDRQSAAVAPSQHDLIALRARAAALRTLAAAARGPRGGVHRGTTPGRGLDFAEVRPYQAGDDLRNVDWRHTARCGRPFTKLFHEEREQPVRLFVDLGATMRFGTRRMFKSVAAAKVAALLAWTTVDAGDRIGGVIHDGRTYHDLPARAREHSALGFIHRLVTSAADAEIARNPASFGAALQAFARGVRPGTCAVVLSDFQALDTTGEHVLHTLRTATRITLVHVFDALESTPPPPGIYRIATPNAECSLDLRDDAARAAYGAPFRARSERLAALSRHLGATLLPLATDDDPLSALAPLFQPRRAA